VVGVGHLIVVISLARLCEEHYARKKSTADCEAEIELLLKPNLLRATSGRAYLNSKDHIRNPNVFQRQVMPSTYYTNGFLHMKRGHNSELLGVSAARESS